MKYGIFTSIYGDYKIEETAARIKAAGFEAVQFNPFNVEGKYIDSLKVSERTIKRYKKAFDKEQLKIAGIGSYGRFLSPDKKEARAAIESTKGWIRLARLLDTNLVITESGSKHPDNNWTEVPENGTDETWEEVVSVYKELTDFAEEYGVLIGIEPHFGQVVKGAKELKKLLEDVGAENLKVVFDAANSVTADNQNEQERILNEFYELLGDSIVLVHAKDALIKEGRTEFTSAGKGVLPYRTLFNVIKKYNYDGPVLLEWVDESGVNETLSFLKEQEIAPYLIPLFRGDPLLYENAQAALNIVHDKEGALELKYRLLLSMVADALTRHPAGAVACGREALEAGASKEEVMEAIRVIYTAGGLPSLIENFDLYREVILK